MSQRELTATGSLLIILSSEIACALPDTKILVNEVLSTTDHLDYLSLGEIAKCMGIRYVWHRPGRFLVRWWEEERLHAKKTHADLSAILSPIKPVTETLSTLKPPVQISSMYSVIDVK